ncbi:hypothetical protein glysoja_032191 [Glycine soja]|uniref:TRF2/HOY1 PH-like domain-containing protein n=1 Tax=Glycine soja TaxID=3848 RepID=A0A0B2PHH8_GLYSO|nr:hypothetical protein glysoja_032191 [Glycine soja]
MDKKRPRSDELANNETNPRRSHSYRQFQSLNNGTAATADYAQNASLTRRLFISRLKENTPLGLRLHETTIKSIRDTMNASYERTRNSAPLMANNLPADFFPATSLKIGEYKANGRIKYKIEVPWQNIMGMQAIVEENKSEILQIELAKAPPFFRHIDPNPRSHPQWEPSKDFTGGHALKYRRHYLGFALGDLSKNYQKLIQSDNRLLELSRQIPSSRLSSPFF